MSPVISINGRRIGPGEPPYVIAELSANHNGSLSTALRIVEEAKSCGADAVKLQTYRPDTITLDLDTEEFRIEGGLWHGRTLHDLYREAHMPWEWHRPLFERAEQLGITLFSSPFDPTAVDLLVELGTPAFKIASFEAVDLPLIRYAASKGKPLIISTGMADEREIADAVLAAREGGCEEIALLHCVSGYPAPAEEYNLLTLPDMIQRFGLVTGLSDHTLENTTAIASVALGAAIIEKHFTLDRSGGGPDDSFSLEPEQMKALCRDTRVAWQALGRVDYSRQASERGNVKFRRSLYFVQDLPKGHVIRSSDIRSVRPGYGLAPKMLDQVIGQRLTREVKYGQPVALHDLDQAM
jgi:N-acetylneuraminate synthase